MLATLILYLAHAKFHVDQDGWIRDENGLARVFHGVNAVYKLPPYLPSNSTVFDPVMSIDTPEDIKFLKVSGFNIVRFGVMWESVEREMGVYDFDYLTRVNEIINNLGKNGIYTMVDSHQDCLSRQICGEGMPNFFVPKLDNTCYNHALSILLALFGQCESIDSYHFTRDA